MPIEKFADKHKDFLTDEFAAKCISLNELANAVRDHHAERFCDTSEDLFSKRFKEVEEVKEEFAFEGNHCKF